MPAVGAALQQAVELACLVMAEVVDVLLYDVKIAGALAQRQEEAYLV
jgi:hypothetical protein